MAAIVEGGNFKCYHGIDTDSVEEWNEHCSDPANNHTESGITKCVGCQDTIVFDNIPYHPIQPDGTKGISLRCEDCEDVYQRAFKNKQVRTIKNPEEGIRMPQPHENISKKERGKELE